MTPGRVPPPAYRRFATRHDIVTDWRGLHRVLADRPAVVDPSNGPGACSTVFLEQEWSWLDESRPGWREQFRVLAAGLGVRLAASPAAARFHETVLTLLLDQSGSMRGDRMRFAAASLDIVQATLSGLGVKVEVLGFTTRFWRGGQSRWWWNVFARRPAPGRLNDLLHIVYRDAEDPAAGESPVAFREMLRPELLKENIDGEALEWAAGRLHARPERRRILLVLSDGAPVDDSTLLENGPDVLSDHLREVIGTIERDGMIELGALGVGFEVDQYYDRAWSVEDADAIGEALLQAIEGMLIGPAA